MANTRGLDAVGVAVLAAGGVMIWSGLKGASILTTVQEVIQGKKPSGTNVHPVNVQLASTGGSVASGPAGSVVAMAEQVANSAPGKAGYCWGGGHSGSPCSAKCFDCSGYVSCVLNKLGLLKGSMITTGFMVWSGASTVPWAQRQPGDLYVSATHIGIISTDIDQMWNDRCTGCGGVQLSSIKGGRSGYIVRRVKGASTGSTPSKGDCMGTGWNNGMSPGNCAGDGTCIWNESKNCWERV